MDKFLTRLCTTLFLILVIPFLLLDTIATLPIAIIYFIFGESLAMGYFSISLSMFFGKMKHIDLD